jgi:hypothetical protein
MTGDSVRRRPALGHDKFGFRGRSGRLEQCPTGSDSPEVEATGHRARMQDTLMTRGVLGVRMLLTSRGQWSMIEEAQHPHLPSVTFANINC